MAQGNQERIQVNMEFDSEASKALEYIANELGVSKGEALRRSIGFAQYATEETLKGNKFVLKKEWTPFPWLYTYTASEEILMREYLFGKP